MKKPRAVRALTKASLERSALHQLERRALTQAELRRLLDRKRYRVERELGADPRVPVWIDEIVMRMTASALVDDARVTEARATSARSRGLSTRAIGAKLARSGVARSLVAETIERVDEARGEAEPELAAAMIYARKKGLSRKPAEKALASLARQGFAYGVAKRALDALTASEG